MARKAKATEPLVPVAVPDPEMDDLAFPAFLDRRNDPSNPKVNLDVIMGGKREWIMPDRNKPKVVAPAPLFVDDRAAAVEVVHSAPNGLAGSILLKRFANMADFEANHDFKSYPVKQAVSAKELTIIQVSPKPWAVKAAAASNGPKAPRPPKAERDFSQPDAAGKPVTAGSSLATILGLLLAGNKSMDQIIKESGVEGGVVSAEDKVLHRIKFVLFRQHGVGHTVDAKGMVKAVLPSGFDKVSIYKVAKGSAPVNPPEPEPVKEPAKPKAKGKGK